MTGCGGALGRWRCCGTLLKWSKAWRTSASVGFAENSTETVTVWPSTTGTRLQCALTLAASGSMWSPWNSPRIFWVSCWIFSSSDRHGDRHRVAVHHRDAVAMRAHLGRQRLDVVALELTQNLLGFLLDLFFFAANKRDHVADNVHGRDARISGA